MPRHARRRKTRLDPNATVYVLKVALAAPGTTWRRIAIRSDQTLDDLHATIFDAFDRYDEHLYSFYLPPPGSKGRRGLRDAAEYTSPLMLQEPDPFGFGERAPHDAGSTTIGSLQLTPGRKLAYLFDFGDQWWHELTVEQADGKRDRGKYPRVLEKRGASPPQYPDVDEDEEDAE